MNVLSVVSGGMDSTVTAHLASETIGAVKVVLAVDYGQRHVRELSCAERAAEKLQAEFIRLDLKSLGKELASHGDALTSESPVPEGHYRADTMAQTVVSNRNMILYSLAAGIAVARNCSTITVGVHGGDHHIYPDCRPEFIDSLERTMRLGMAGYGGELFKIFAPFVNKDKTAVVREGYRLGVNFLDTWSCYVGGDIHCGRCGTCVERIEAFSLAGVDDPTPYGDRTFAAKVLAG